MWWAVGLGDDVKYEMLSAEQLQYEREVIQADVDAEIARLRTEAGEVRIDSESAMLRGHEATRSIHIYNELRQKYATTILEKGGIEAVLKELEDFIIGKLGDEQCRGSINKRKYNPSDPLEIKQLKAALRAILDDAPSPPSHFGSFLHPGATQQIGADWGHGIPNGREVLAHFWLAASDPEMTLDPDDEKNREQCVRAEKMMVIAGLSDIRRGHNDGSYSPVDGIADDPSCGPGTWGRIAKMHVHNTLTQMGPSMVDESPAPKFKRQIDPFIIEQFKNVNIPQQLEIINALYHYLMGGKKTDEAPYATLERLIDYIKLNRELCNLWVEKLTNEYGNINDYSHEKYLDRNHLKLAIITFHEELFRAKVEPSSNLVQRLQSVAIENLFKPTTESVIQLLDTFTEVQRSRDALIKITQSQKNILLALEQINIKVQQLDKNTKDFSQKLEALKVEKNLLSTQFNEHIRAREHHVKFIEEFAKKKIIIEVRKHLLDSLVVFTEQVDEMMETLYPEESLQVVVQQLTKLAIKEVSPSQSTLSLEIAEITVNDIKKNHAYKQIEHLYKAQGKLPEEVQDLTQTRILKAIINSNYPDLEPDKILALVEEWKMAQLANPMVVQQESFFSEQTVEPIPLEHQISVADGIKYYEQARKIGSTDKAAYDDAIKKAQASGINCELAIDAGAFKKQGLDRVVINPRWLTEIQANIEEIEETCKLKSACVSTAISNIRYEKLLQLFNAFSEKNTRKIKESEMLLNQAADRYFKELSKKSPDQAVLQERFQLLQECRQNVMLEIDAHIEEFKAFLLEKNQPFYESDNTYLHYIMINSDRIKAMLGPEHHALFTSISDRMQQLSRMEPLHSAHDRAIDKAKRDCLNVVEQFFGMVSENRTILEARHAKKGSIAAKQCAAFKVAEDNLRLLNADELAREPKRHNIEAFQELGMNSIRVSNQLDVDLNNIGQASKYRRKVRSFKNSVRGVFSKVGLSAVRKEPKEFSLAQIGSIKLEDKVVDVQEQNSEISIKREALMLHDNLRQPALLSTFGKFYRENDRSKNLLTQEEAKLALEYIQANIDNPFKLNLNEQFKEGASVTIVSDLHQDPITLRFENPLTKDAPKLIKKEAHELKEFAKWQLERNQPRFR